MYKPSPLRKLHVVVVRGFTEEAVDSFITLYIFNKKKGLQAYFYFILAVFMGLEPVQRTIKQRKGASQQINQIKMVSNVRYRECEVRCLNHSTTTRSELVMVVYFLFHIRTILCGEEESKTVNQDRDGE